MRIIRTLALGLAGVALAGCAENDKDRAEVKIPTFDGSPIPASARGTPDILPPAVLEAFERDYPDGDILDVKPLVAETGDPLYRITFTTQNDLGSAMYFANGTRFSRPPPRMAPPAPAPRGPPATRPARPMPMRDPLESV